MNNTQPPCWIDTIDPDEADTELRKMYQELGASYNKIHNLYRAFSLQPKPLMAADRLYRDILHNDANHSEPWFLELLATQCAIIADCNYAFTHHGANFKALLGDEQLGDKMIQALRDEQFDSTELFNPKHAALLKYCNKLSRTPEHMVFEDLETLRQAGVSDTEILEAVQTSANFAYWVRFINALGINLGNESIGMY